MMGFVMGCTMLGMGVVMGSTMMCGLGVAMLCMWLAIKFDKI